MIGYIFAYGSLNPELAPPEIAHIVAHFELIGEGFVFGKLFQFERFRGAILGDESDGRITGHLYRFQADPLVIDELDRYENFDPENEAASLFVRRPAVVYMKHGSVEAWVYVYNGDTAGRVPVDS